MKKYQQATLLLNNALKSYQQYEYSSRQAPCYTNLGIIQYEQNHYYSAIFYYSKAIKFYELENDSEGLLLNFENLAESLIAKYDSLKTKDKNLLYSALKYSNKALTLTYNNYYLNAIYYSLIKIYERLNDKLKAYQYAVSYIATKDSLFSQEKTQTLAKAEALYQNEKQRTIIISVIIGLVLVGILLFVVIYFLRLYQIANRKLIIKNHQITKQKEVIAVQRDKIASQRDIVMQQKAQIESYHNALKYCIYYAENIQKVALPGKSLLSELLQNYFLLNLPRDIVSGDFY